MTKTNTHKLNDRWRTIMRELKAKELIGEIEVSLPAYSCEHDMRNVGVETYADLHQSFPH